MEATWAWRVLGVAPGSPPDVCRGAFRAAAQLLHPDRVADLPPDVQAEAHRRMVELGEAYRVCCTLTSAAVPRRRATRARGGRGQLPAAGDQAADLLVQAIGLTAPREAVIALEQVADAWPGTIEGDRARALLVTSAGARGSLSARERAGHLVLIVDDDARREAWDSLGGREELVVAQVVYAHPTADESLRRTARARLAELDDWATLCDDTDDDVRRTARAKVLLRDGATLLERAQWLTRRERPSFDADLAGWRERAEAARGDHVDDVVRSEVDRLERAIRGALVPARAGRG